MGDLKIRQRVRADVKKKKNNPKNEGKDVLINLLWVRGGV